jgi:hypothetical protein
MFGTKKLFFFMLFCCSSIFCTTIYLHNDSPFTLIAVIKAADGSVIGQTKLEPNEEIFFNLEAQNQAKVSSTPYTVVWQCPHGGWYSVCSPASPGSLIRANSGTGQKYCAPEEKKPTCPPCAPCPACPITPETPRESK